VVLGVPFALRAGLSRFRVAGAAWGGGLVALALVAVATAESGTGLVVAALVAGLGSAVCAAAHRDLLSDLYPPLGLTYVLVAHRALALAAGGAGLLLAFPVAETFGLTWRGVLLGLGGVVAAASLLVTVIAEPVRGAHEASAVRRLAGADHDADAPRVPSFGEALRRLYAIPTVRPLLAVTAVTTALGYGLVVFGGYALTQRGGLASSAPPIVLAVAAVVGALTATQLAERAAVQLRVAPHRLAGDTVVALVATGAAVALVGLTPWWPVTAAGMVLAVTCLVCACAALDRLAAVVVPPALRGAFGALAAAYAGVLGVALGGGAIAAVDGAVGLPLTFVALGVVAGIAALVARAAARTVDADLQAALGGLVEAEESAVARARGVQPPLLTCRGINFSYGPLQILFDVDFTVDDGEMVALLGTNGAGKSTLLRVISGLGIPSSGSVRVSGQDITYAEPGERVRLGVSQIPGGKAVFGPLSVVENLRMYGYALGRDRRAVERGIDEAFATFPRLAERRNAPASTMSGGEQQMLALSKALILSPRLLLIDELSLGLAPKVVGELLTLVRRINDGGTSVVLVEQSVNVALSLAEHAYFMEKGQVRFDGRTADLLERPDILRSVFLSGVAAGTAS
jgi:ABC-type branched-subunit amino acid transport system ATPase component